MSPSGLRLLATYGADGLQRMLTTVFDRLRSAGRPLVLAAEVTSALEDAVAALRESADETLRFTDPLLEGRAQVEHALELLGEEPPAADRLRDLSELRVPGPDRERFAGFEQGARRARARSRSRRPATRDPGASRAAPPGIRRRLPRGEGGRVGALDFEDLQLVARELLQGNETVREAAQWRFRPLLVDEFQDTNLPQCEAIDLVGNDEVFFVGDEFQSIYRFRHADVEVFRQRREASAGVLALTENYRSRPGVLAVVNQLFGAEFGGTALPVAAGWFEEPLFGPAVECPLSPTSRLATAKATHWRVAEAWPPRGASASSSMPATPRPATSCCSRRAPTPSATRKRFAPRDFRRTARRAAATLASSRSATSRCTCAFLRQPLRRRGKCSSASSPHCSSACRTTRSSSCAGQPEDGRSTPGSSVSSRGSSGRATSASSKRSSSATTGSSASARVSGSRRSATASSPSTTTTWRCSRAGTVAGGTPTCESSGAWRGRTRSCAAPTSKGFLRFLADQETVGAKEPGRGDRGRRDAVRLLTIHSAKGLEFKVVVVADAGLQLEHAAREEILCLPDGRVGFKVVDLSTGHWRHAALGFGLLREAERVAEEAETRRLYYVAMTRAVDRLIISGAVDPTSQRDARALPGAGFSTGSKPTSRPCPPTVRRRPSATAPACSCARTVASSSKRARPCRPPTSCRSSCRPTAAWLAWPRAAAARSDPGSRRQRASGGSRIALALFEPLLVSL